MPKVGIIISSIRQNRFADHPAKWIFEKASKRNSFEVELIDLRDYPMPFFAEATAPGWAPSPSEDPVARRWQEKLGQMDGFIIVAAEYNRGPTAVLKNALDYAYHQWNKKPIAFVGYGSTGAARAIEQLRTNAIELQMAPIRVAVHILLPVFMEVMQGKKRLDEYDFLDQTADDMLDQLTWWLEALKTARDKAA
jgi:NAD(P)H-dependent FMN reductase